MYSLAMKDIGWLAGILEGEGWFGYYNTARVAINMTDPDVIQRVKTLFGGSVYLPKPRENRKQLYCWAASGGRAAGIMMTVYPMLGARRQARVREVLMQWLAPKRHRTAQSCLCHPERKHCAKGWCKSCYNIRRERDGRVEDARV